MGLLDGFVYGLLGGIASEVWGLYNMRYDFHENKPKWITSYFYWILTISMILIGGGTVCLYIKAGVNVNEFMAVHLGVSTPLLISAMIKEAPKIN